MGTGLLGPTAITSRPSGWRRAAAGRELVCVEALELVTASETTSR
jgi:hypothetical protein